jgi:hypothetical protein
MGALDSGAGEGGVERCLDGSRVWQESPVEVQHHKEAAELAGGLRRRAVLQISHSFLRWSGTLSGHSVAEEGDLGCAEDALRRVDEDPVPLETVEKSPEVLLMLLTAPGENEDVVQVGKAEVESPQHLVHKSLERLGGVTQAEGHERELEKAKGSCDGGLLDVAGMDGELVVRSHQVNF